MGYKRGNEEECGMRPALRTLKVVVVAEESNGLIGREQSSGEHNHGRHNGPSSRRQTVNNRTVQHIHYIIEIESSF